MSPPEETPRWFFVTSAVLMCALLFTGLAALLLGSPDEDATAVANSGEVVAATPQSRLGFLHDNLAVFLLLFVLIGGAWLLLKVKREWMNSLPGAFIAVVVAGVSGWSIVYDAIEIGGVFVEDQRGIWFVFDPNFDGALSGARYVGSTAYRVALTVHLVASAAFVAAIWLSRKELRKPARDVFVEGRRAARSNPPGE